MKKLVILLIIVVGVTFPINSFANDGKKLLGEILNGVLNELDKGKINKKSKNKQKLASTSSQCQSTTGKSQSYWNGEVQNVINSGNGQEALKIFEHEPFVRSSNANQYAQLFCQSFYESISLPEFCLRNDLRSEVQTLFNRYRCNKLCALYPGQIPWC